MVACSSFSCIFNSLSPHSISPQNPNFPTLCKSNNISLLLNNDCSAFCSRLKWSPRDFSNDCKRSSPRDFTNDCKRSRFIDLYSQSEKEAEKEREIRERRVRCEVEVISWRERRIKADIAVNADVQSVWSALTDYERLADFIPNLVSSGRIPCPHPGRIWLEQRGLQRALYWHIEARVVLDLQEFLCSLHDRELHFSMVDGDFKKFEGKWSIKLARRSSSTTLSYEVNVIPRFNFPAIFLERIIQSDLPINLRALACRAESNFEGIQKIQSTKTLPSETALNAHSEVLDLRPKFANGELRGSFSSSSFGPLSQNPELGSNWGVFGNVCKLDKPCMVDEIHLRRFDGLLENGGVHRCVSASITVKAPVREVWNVLTAYESLPEIVPNLAISKVLSRDNNKVRILQEGCKGLLYMVLHARVVMDLCEHLEEEISFEQVEGDFDSFQGKWQFEQLGNHHTLLKYSVESKMHKDTFLSEAIMEEVIYEDLPSNLCAIRDHIERRTGKTCQMTGRMQQGAHPSTSSREQNEIDYRKPAGQGSDFSVSSPFRQKPRVPGLQRDIEVLKSELLKFISEHGQEGFMPLRKQLRLHGRVDIEKAITRMGGFRKIATLMNLSLAYKNRKPKGYWDSLENLQDEIVRFQKNWGMDPSYMPSRKTFERAGLASSEEIELIWKKLYITNTVKVAFLEQRPLTRLFKSSRNACITCHRNLQDPYLFCCLPCKVQHTIATQGRMWTLLSSHHMLKTLELDDCQITSDSVLVPLASLSTSSSSTTSSGGQGPPPQCTIFSTATFEFVKKKQRRYDIARALEKWGGLHEVSRLLSLKVRHPGKQSNIAKDKKNDYVATANGEGDVKTASKPYVSQDTQKWLTKLKHFDINWVE